MPNQIKIILTKINHRLPSWDMFKPGVGEHPAYNLAGFIFFIYSAMLLSFKIKYTTVKLRHCLLQIEALFIANWGTVYCKIFSESFHIRKTLVHNIGKTCSTNGKERRVAWASFLFFDQKILGFMGKPLFVIIQQIYFIVCYVLNFLEYFWSNINS